MAEVASIAPEWETMETQKNEIVKLSKKALQKGDIWCLVDNNWFKQWKKYVGYDSLETANAGDRAFHPGPLDNSLLLRDDGSNEIKDHLRDEVDYVLLPEEAWNLLVQWYGITEGQLVIARKVIKYGLFISHFKVEVYAVDFKLCLNSDLEHVVNKKFSKSDTIEFIKKEMRSLFNIPDEKETRLWTRYHSRNYEHLSNEESTVYEAGLYHGQVLIMEESNEDGTWSKEGKITRDGLAYTNSPIWMQEVADHITT